MRQLDIKVLNVIDAWCNHEVLFCNLINALRNMTKNLHARVRATFPVQESNIIKNYKGFRCTIFSGQHLFHLHPF